MMDTKKIYRDSEEMDHAWKELIESIKPLNVSKVTASPLPPSESKPVAHSKTKRLHHPAFITPQDLKTWEFFG